MSFAKWKEELEARCKAFLVGMKEKISPVEPVVQIDNDWVTKVFTGNKYSGGLHLVCPLCGGGYTHIRSAFARRGTDEYEGGKGYLGVQTQGKTDCRRDALCIGVEGECGHNFNIVFQQCTGVENIDVEIPKKDWSRLTDMEAEKC